MNTDRAATRFDRTACKAAATAKFTRNNDGCKGYYKRIAAKAARRANKAAARCY